MSVRRGVCLGWNPGPWPERRPSQTRGLIRQDTARPLLVAGDSRGGRHGWRHGSVRWAETLQPQGCPRPSTACPTEEPSALGSLRLGLRGGNESCGPSAPGRGMVHTERALLAWGAADRWCGQWGSCPGPLLRPGKSNQAALPRTMRCSNFCLTMPTWFHFPPFLWREICIFLQEVNI